MSRHTLGIYVLRAGPRGEDADLSTLGPSETPVLDMLEGFLADLSDEPFTSEGDDVNLSVDPTTLKREGAADLRVFLRRGESGVASNLYLAGHEHETPEFTRTPDHSEVMPALFMVRHRRSVRTKTLAVFHSPNNRGIKTRLQKYLHSCFVRSGMILRIDSMTPAQVWREALRQGRLAEVELLKYAPGGDIVSNLNVFDPAGENVGTLRTTLSVKRGFLPGFAHQPIEEVLEGAAEIGALLTWGGLTYDRIKVRVVGPTGHRSTIDVSQGVAPRFEHDVTDDLVIDRGYPTEETLVAAATELLNEIERNPSWTQT